MDNKVLWRYLPPLGPVVSLLLIGLVLLSGLLYYRAIKIQRYLEPMLAMSLPRNEFSRTLYQLFEKEFGTETMKGSTIKMGTIFLERSSLFYPDGSIRPEAREPLKKLARIFLSILAEEHTRSHINLVLMSARYQSSGANTEERKSAQRMIGIMLDYLFLAEPELGRRYGSFFEAAVQPAVTGGLGNDVIELRIIPSELLHIEVLEKLKKYAAY